MEPLDPFIRLIPSYSEEIERGRDIWLIMIILLQESLGMNLMVMSVYAHL